MGQPATAAGRTPSALSRLGLVSKWGQLATVLLVVGLALAIATDGIMPALGTKALLASILPLNIVAALWLTRE